MRTIEIKNELNLYREKFGENFPIMQAPNNTEEIRKTINECINKNKKASELYPELYGSCIGIYI